MLKLTSSQHSLNQVGRKCHLFIKLDDPVWWNDKVGMLTESTELINEVFSKTMALGVICTLAPRTTDGNYFLHSNNKVNDQLLCMLISLYIVIHFINYKSKTMNY